MNVPRNPAIRILALALASLLFAFPAATFAQTSDPANRLLVEAAGGEVKIKFDNRWQSPAHGMVVGLPAVVSTGTRGSLRLRQGDTVISVAANTAIELLAGTLPGELLQRVIQTSGSAFYDIAPRESKRFRVETPYLVAVIKGTQFNVTHVQETSTVALFEGRLQIEAPDVGDSVALMEGQIAKRHRDDQRITVLSMDDGKTASRNGDPSPVDTGGDDSTAADNGSPGTGIGGEPSDSELRADDTPSGTRPAPGLDAGPLDVALGGSADLDGNAAETGLDVLLNPGSGKIAAELDAGASLPGTAVDAGLGAGIDPGAGTVDASVDAGADLGIASVTSGVDAAVDLGAGTVDAGVDAAVGVGDVTADAALDVGADLGAGSVDAAVDTGIAVGDATVDIAVDAGADLGAGTVDAALDAGLGVGDATVDTAVEVGADLGSGTVSAGLDVAGVELDLSLGTDGGLLDADLGTDTDPATDPADTPTTEESPAPVLPDIRNLLGL